MEHPRDPDVDWIEKLLGGGRLREGRPRAVWDWTGDRLRVRIVKTPDPMQFELFDVSRFEVGQVYDVGTRLAELMMVDGCAEPEMHPADRATDKPPRKPGP